MLLQFLIEVSSIFDFSSDVVVIFALAYSEHTGWFAFSLLTVISPYLTVYTSIINCQIARLRDPRHGQKSFLRQLVTILLILPTMILILMFLDIFSMVFSGLGLTILLPCSIFILGELLFEKIEEVENSVFFKLLGLSQMEV